MIPGAVTAWPDILMRTPSLVVVVWSPTWLTLTLSGSSTDFWKLFWPFWLPFVWSHDLPLNFLNWFWIQFLIWLTMVSPSLSFKFTLLWFLATQFHIFYFLTLCNSLNLVLFKYKYHLPHSLSYLFTQYVFLETRCTKTKSLPPRNRIKTQEAPSDRHGKGHVEIHT